MISPERLKELLTYNPETGDIFWIDNEKVYIRVRGKKAFTATGAGGYKVGKVDGKYILAHRAIWAIETGCWPDSVIDHINHDKSDNKWSNLRAASISQNSANRSTGWGISKFLGVTKRKDTGRWTAQIKVNGTHKSLGTFDTEEEAAFAYNVAAADTHGKYASLNKI
jgi:hypothetical protein